LLPPFEPGANPPQTGPDAAHAAPPPPAISALDIAKRVLVLLLASGITIALCLMVDRETIMRFQRWGYFGIFLTSLIGNASIALPIPSLFFTFVGGGTFNWIVVGLVSGIGEALGESTGYMVGYGGSAIIENRALYNKMHHWMEKYGGLTVFVLSVVPNPIIDLAGIVSGASRFGYIKFLLYCWAGKTIKTLAFAWAGAHSVIWILWLIKG
jgi:membrane protein DedA with SNARE-associated domain